jgi:hypothetical protein
VVGLGHVLRPCPQRLRARLSGSRPAYNGPVDPLQLPGGDLVSKGVADLARGEETLEALLVSIGSERLRTAGLRVDAPIRDPEHRLYQLLAQVDQDSAHSRYNALLRRLTSFESALECVK